MQISFHIHAFIERPSSVDYWTFNDNLKKYFRQYASRAYKSEVTDELWIQPLNKSLIANHTQIQVVNKIIEKWKNSQSV